MHFSQTQLTFSKAHQAKDLLVGAESHGPLSTFHAWLSHQFLIIAMNLLFLFQYSTCEKLVFFKQRKAAATDHTSIGKLGKSGLHNHPSL